MKQIVTTDRAPAAIGPYSQAVMCGGMVFVSGQLPIDPATGRLVEGPIERQAEQVLNNLEGILASVHLGFESVVKTTIYLADMADFKAVNGVYATRFPAEPPARATIGVAALPLGARVEIECIAMV